MSEPLDRGCRIYHRSGQIDRLPMFEKEVAVDSLNLSTVAAMVPVTQIMSRDVICARPDLTIEAVIDLVVHNYIGCVPVVDARGRPVGMISSRELIEPLANRVATAEESPRWCELAPQSAGEVMQRITLSLDQYATVSDAASMMTREYIHHIPIVSTKGTVIGLVSSLDVVTWLARGDDVDASGRAASGRLPSLQSSRRTGQRTAQ